MRPRGGDTRPRRRAPPPGQVRRGRERARGHRRLRGPPLRGDEPQRAPHLLPAHRMQTAGRHNLNVRQSKRPAARMLPVERTRRGAEDARRRDDHGRRGLRRVRSQR